MSEPVAVRHRTRGLLPVIIIPRDSALGDVFWLAEISRFGRDFGDALAVVHRHGIQLFSERHIPWALPEAVTPSAASIKKCHVTFIYMGKAVQSPLTTYDRRSPNTRSRLANASAKHVRRAPGVPDRGFSALWTAILLPSSGRAGIVSYTRLGNPAIPRAIIGPKTIPTK
ncbi:hypothetical protein B0H10DRAFT_1951453 [Mycena sp. CBHHK59/15]|nr:hypothetical protein B0H10DRAFT_1951453 [Mycena sp. CBHHK59/15]